MVRHRPAHGLHVDPNLSARQSSSVTRTALNNPSARAIFRSVRHADG